VRNVLVWIAMLIFVTIVIAGAVYYGDTLPIYGAPPAQAP